MITQGTRIINARTGQVMTFLQTGAGRRGELLRIDCISPPSSMREPEHIHPLQENKFEIISGSCTFSIDGKEQLAKAGDTVTIPPRTRHFFWNAGNEDAHYIQEFRPAGTIAGFFDTFFALSRDGKLNEKGIPNFFHASVIMLKHKDDIRVISPPWPIQLITYVLLAPIGRLMGHQASYRSKN
ncbi:MAG TPA: cupin domain-containing protein [Flavobacteriales bacterium]|nr:cupin domain-containing protein [Flavobacteriales bacterium]